MPEVFAYHNSIFRSLFEELSFCFLVKELHLVLVLLYEIKFSLDGQFKYLFFTLDLFIIPLLRSLVIKRT